MLAVKVLPKGQITLPREVRRRLGIQEGDTLLLDMSGEQAVLRKGKTIFDFRGALPDPGFEVDEIRKRGLTGTGS